MKEPLVVTAVKREERLRRLSKPRRTNKKEQAIHLLKRQRVQQRLRADVLTS